MEENLFKEIQAVKGFLDEEEGRRLHDLALAAAELGPCLEIGGYCGKSTAYIGLACRRRGQVLFSVDHHRGSEEQQPGQAYCDPDLVDAADGRVDTLPFFRRTLARFSLEETVVAVVAPSALAARHWRTPLGLVFIDGSHAFPSVFADYASWSPHLLPGGFLAIHDVFPDPAAGGQAPWAVYEMALASGLFVELPMVKSLGILQRTAAGEVTPRALAWRERYAG
ncbi:MAG TPA: class I SAM-dependent methyltransferase [Syntrophales bacterium]|nr:class I SAM-dependent methyltransferase [Syntrophales bacterium]HOM07167.1 class I SAM-dependent methyltransferase [Syntrophales bacterium]HOO00426.1 class I SAM-dependent methyltransferase [Syntrophales bacterium]HPC01356.1 class I SAM-dependent methyltransferase [Syntrophales bacterium]HPQ06754.1 class I SAM-dependent methyltransferase [Syntrophales bacterium]